jgi:hypothetical protein
LETLDGIFRDDCWNKNRHESLRLICGILDAKFALELVSRLMSLSVDRVDYLDDKNLATKRLFEKFSLTLFDTSDTVYLPRENRCLDDL